MTSTSQLTREPQAPPLEALYLINVPSHLPQVRDPCPKSHLEDLGVSMPEWPTLTATLIHAWRLLVGNSGPALALKLPGSPLLSMETMARDQVSQSAPHSPPSSMTPVLLSSKLLISLSPYPGSTLPTWTVLLSHRERLLPPLPSQALSLPVQLQLLALPSCLLSQLPLPL